MTSPAKSQKTVAAKPLTGPFELVLCSVGNPDFRQYAPLSEPERVTIATLEEASAKVRAYIEFWSLGGGNWGMRSGKLYVGKKHVATVSYNGRIWPPGTWTSETKPLYG